MTTFVLCDALEMHDGLDDAPVTLDAPCDALETCDVLDNDLSTFGGRKKFDVLAECDDQNRHVGCDVRHADPGDENRLFGFDIVPAGTELVRRLEDCVGQDNGDLKT